jgi:hypothetical protein
MASPVCERTARNAWTVGSSDRKDSGWRSSPLAGPLISLHTLFTRSNDS